MSIQHSPGPWTVVDGSLPGFIEIKGPVFPLSIVMVATDITLTNAMTRRADALLIAAAPSMLAALHAIDTGQCENFTTGYGSCAKNGHTIDAKYSADRICDSCIAHAAIAQATGGKA